MCRIRIGTRVPCRSSPGLDGGSCLVWCFPALPPSSRSNHATNITCKMFVCTDRCTFVRTFVGCVKFAHLTRHALTGACTTLPSLPSHLDTVTVHTPQVPSPEHPFLVPVSLGKHAPVTLLGDEGGGGRRR